MIKALTNNEKLRNALRLLEEVNANVTEYSTIHSATRGAINALRSVPTPSLKTR